MLDPDTMEALNALEARIRRLERRLNELEPETVPGVGRESYAAPPSDSVSDSPILDGLADAMAALGLMGKEG